MTYDFGDHFDFGDFDHFDDFDFDAMPNDDLPMT